MELFSKKKQQTVIAPEASPQVYRRDRGDSVTISTQVAGGALYCRNFKFKNAAQHFPIDPLLRTVDKFYQFAKDGPLYVDEPLNESDLKNCYRKAQVMREEGLRYVIITKETTFEQAMSQLQDKDGAA